MCNKRSQGPFKHQQHCRTPRNLYYLPSASCHRLSPEMPPQTPSSTQSGRQCCSALAVPSTSYPAQAPTGRTASARTITAETMPAPSPPPAKRMRKAAKRRCEVELLRGIGDGVIRLLPSPTTAASPTPVHSPSLPVTPQRPPTPTFCTPDHSTPAPAPSPVSLPPSPLEPSSPLQMGVKANNVPTSPAPSPTLWTQVLKRSVNRLISLAKMVGF